jgi:hypothetical protein
MADTTKLIVIDIDTDAAVKDIIALKETIAVLTKQTAKAKEETGELSAEYIQYSASLKGAQQDLSKLEKNLITVSKAQNANAGSIEQARLQLTAISAEWAKVTNIEGENSARSKELTAEKLRLKTVITELETATGTYTGQVGNYEIATKSLKLELRENITALARMKAAGDDNTEAYQKLLKTTGQLQDTIADTREEIKKYASDTQTIDKAIGIFKGLGAAAQVAEGSIALLGVEDENLAKSIQKMVAIQGVMNGVQEIGNALQKESAFMMGVVSIKTKVVTAAQWLWNVAVTANPIGLLVVAVAALAAGVSYLAVKMNSGSKDTTDYLGNLSKLEAINKKNAAFDDFHIKVMEAKGKADVDITNEMIANNKKRQSELELENATIMAAANSDNITSAQKIENAKKLEKNFEDARKAREAETLLSILLSSQLNTREAENQKKQEQQEKDYIVQNIESAQTIYDTKKLLRDQAASEENFNIEKIRATDKQLYSDSLLLIKSNAKAELITEEEAAKQKTQLKIDFKNSNAALDKEDQDRKKKAAEESIALMDYELQVWQAANQSKIESDTVLNDTLVAQEQIRLEKEDALKMAMLTKELESGLITQVAFNSQKLALEQEHLTAMNQLKADNAATQEEQEKQVLALKYEAAQENIFAQVAAERAINEKKRADELKAAGTNGALISLVNAKYDKADLALNKVTTKAKLDLAGGFAGNLATIFGEQTKVGKAAAVAQTTISTYESAQASYTGMVKAIPGPIGVVLGIAAAGAAGTSGIANVKKILAVNPSGGGGAPSADTPSAPSVSVPQAVSSLQSANTDIGNGIVSRATNGGVDSALKLQPTLVVDKVTDAQNSEAARKQTATI